MRMLPTQEGKKTLHKKLLETYNMQPKIQGTYTAKLPLD